MRSITASGREQILAREVRVARHVEWKEFPVSTICCIPAPVNKGNALGNAARFYSFKSQLDLQRAAVEDERPRGLLTGEPDIDRPLGRRPHPGTRP